MVFSNFSQAITYEIETNSFIFSILVKFSGLLEFFSSFFKFQLKIFPFEINNIIAEYLCENYLNDNDLKDLEQDYSMIMKNVLPDSKIAVYRPLLIEDVNQIVLSLRNDKRVSSVRLDFRDPLILPE